MKGGGRKRVRGEEGEKNPKGGGLGMVGCRGGKELGEEGSKG